MDVVLVAPEIHGNTGNIARTCAATGCGLHLVEPLGFTLDDRHLKRAGLDYWPLVRVLVHQDFDAVERMCTSRRMFLYSGRGRVAYTEVAYGPDDVLVFGCESVGLPKEMLDRYPDNVLRIPMIGNVRSLNLGNAVSIVVYEALRQQGFVGMH